MQIREATAADGEAIAALLTELGYPVSHALIINNLQHQASCNDTKVLVAIEANHVLGFVALNFMPQLAFSGDFCRISYFCVSHAARGQGIGTALEETLTALAYARSCDRIEVHCHSQRSRAHQFYRRQGYTESPKYFVKRLTAAV